MNQLNLPAEILKEILKEVDLLDHRIRALTQTENTDDGNNLTSLARTCSALHALVIPFIYSRFTVVWGISRSNHTGTEVAFGHVLTTLVKSNNPSCSCRRSTSQALGGKTRWRNDYAQYMREFSLRYCWPNECFSKTTGRIVGLKISLAVMKLVNLETFNWDIPSPIWRDVWNALSALGDSSYTGRECCLERVWIRWHYIQTKYPPSKYPTLSILPPLKSLTVLDINDPHYLEEMAILIERSKDQLKELRIGIASKAESESWGKPSKNLLSQRQRDIFTKWPKPGGALEVLNGPFMYPPSAGSAESQAANVEIADTLQPVEEQSVSVQRKNTPHDSSTDRSSKLSINSCHTFQNVEVLELERVYISIPIIMQTIDWTKLSTLALLGCRGKHEKLWRSLCHRYRPSMTNQKGPQDASAPSSPLRIKHIHTDAVSPSLISFLTHTFAPNTLETMFLHEVLPYYESKVSVNEIKTVLCRHRLSLKKVLVNVTNHLTERSGNSKRWRRWRFNRDILSFVMNAKMMPQLRKLSVAIDGRDWDFLVQQLPNAPNLRALHINKMNDQRSRVPPDLLAHQLMNMVSIMPHLSLADFQIVDNRYEIIEADLADDRDEATESDAECDFTPKWGSHARGDDDADSSDDEDDLVDEFSDYSGSDPFLTKGYKDDIAVEFEKEKSRRRVFKLRVIDNTKSNDWIDIFRAQHGRLLL